MKEQPRAASVRPPLRAVLVDDHEVVREGLVAVLGRHRVAIVGQAGDVAGAVDVVTSTRPAVVVLDVRIPGGGAPAVLAALEEAMGVARPPVLAVSASDERDDVLATVRAGATGYLLKTAAAERIAAAVRSTADGEPVFSPELAGHLLDLDLDATATGDEAWEDLTERQVEVLRLLARGMTYRQIAEELVVSDRTVESHVRRLLHALQLTNRHEAARWAHDRNL